MSIIILVAKVILLASLIGMLVIFYRKAPLLANLPKTTPVFDSKKRVWANLLGKIRVKLAELPWLKNFSFEILLQKLLSKTRILTMKFENRISAWLESLRNRTKKKNGAVNQESDNYWEKLETEKEKKDLPR